MPSLGEDVCTLDRLSNCFKNRSDDSQSLTDANKAVEYAEEALAELKPEDPEYPEYVSSLAGCLLFRSNLRTNDVDRAEDSSRAVELCKEALQLWVTNIGAAEGQIMDIHSPQTKSSSPAVCISSGTFINLRVLWVLGNMTLALNQKAISVNDLRECINIYTTVLDNMDETNPKMWMTLSDALFACHNATQDQVNKALEPSLTGIPLNNQDINAAIDCYQKGLELAPKEGYIQRNLHNLLAEGLLRRDGTGELDEAIKHRIAVNLDREEYPLFLGHLANALLKQRVCPLTSQRQSVSVVKRS